MSVSFGNGVDLGNLVTATTNPLTGGIELSAGGVMAIAIRPVNLDGSPAENAVTLQSAIDVAGCVIIVGNAGDVFDISETILLGDDSHIYLSDNITLRRVGSGSTQLFSNRDKVTGNSNISIIGNATLDFNVSGVSGVAANIRSWNGLNFVNVDGLRVSGTDRGQLKMRDAYKFLLFCANVRNFVFENLNFQSSGGDPVPGRDGIHLAGRSSNGVIQKIFGSTNDDFIAINPAAIPLNPNECYANGMGPIRNVVVRDIFGSVIDRSGSVVHLYGSSFSDEAQTVIDGNPDAAVATSTKPQIVSMSYTNGVVTVTTDKPHLMAAGDPFKVTGAVHADLNVSMGFVDTVPTGTTFTYRKQSGGAWSSGGDLTIYWHLDNVLVENVHGDTYQSLVVGLDTWGGRPGAGGVMRNVTVRNVSGSKGNPAATNSALVGGASIRLVNCHIDSLLTKTNYQFPALRFSNLGGRETCETINCRFSNISSDKPYLSDQSTGWGLVVFMNGKHTDLTIEKVRYINGEISGSWRVGMHLYPDAGSTIVIKDSLIGHVSTGLRGTLARLLTLSDDTSVTLENCVAMSPCEALVTVGDGANVTGGFVRVLGGYVPSGSESAIKVFGNAIEAHIDGLRSLSSNAPVLFSGNAANGVAVIGDSVVYASALAVALSGNGPYTVTGWRAKQNVADAKLNRAAGAVLYNTNAAAGTLAAAGVVTCDASGAAGSWKLLTDPAKNF